ncbi:hypothetical protein [Spirillospora sp. NPDC047279]|uniref:hypothetical protein n=1 Tax=Spirillospora sp. NPDC047279 TaxID=3155478 RepID=UPI0033CDE05F
MADNWLGPDTCGVKLVQFEQMAQDMTRAVSQLEDLADQLWQALNGAKVDTAPAMEIKRLATWAHEAATDLRRRNTLAHDLDRQKLAIEVCRLDGTYLTLPDRYTDQVAYGEGSRLAGLVRRAAAGDRKALADLRRYDPKDVTPALAKALVRTLGADGLLRLPVDLGRRLTVDVHQEGGDAVARDTRNVLAILGRSLALTTDPGRSGYVGDAFFTQIMAAGRTTFPPGTEPPRGAAGYQSLSTLMTAAGNARFSARFMGTVGADMVDYDRHLPKNLGPLPELSGHYDLGNALDPSTTKVTVGDRGTDFLLPLLHAAAASGREGAQALLSHAPMGPHPAKTPASGRNSNLAYLLSSRRELWAKTDHGAALGATLKTAASGTDKDSERLAFEAARILATDARKYWVIKEGKLSAVDESGGGNLLKGTFSLSNPKEAMAAYSRVSNPIQDIDAISALRPYMAEVLATHMAKVNDVFEQARSAGPEAYR